MSTTPSHAFIASNRLEYGHPEDLRIPKDPNDERESRTALRHESCQAKTMNSAFLRFYVKIHIYPRLGYRTCSSDLVPLGCV